MSDRNARLNALNAALRERILILDGGMGTMIQSYKFEESDFRGERFVDWPSDLKGNNDLLVITQPDAIAAMEKAYLDAGADIIETNTFNSTSVSQADYGMQDLAYELNLEGARLARRVCDEKTVETPDRPRFVAGVLGPTSRTCSLSPDVNNPGYRNITFDQLVEDYINSTKGLIEGGADLILIEIHFRYAECQGRDLCRTGNLRPVGRGTADHDFRHHHRRLRPYPVRADHRSFLELGVPCQTHFRGSELRAGRQGTAPLSGRAVRQGRHAYLRSPECRPAERVW